MFRRGDLVSHYYHFDQSDATVVAEIDGYVLIDIGTFEPLVVRHPAADWYKVGEMDNPPKDWRDRWGVNKHWYDINAEPLWRDGQRVQYVHDEFVYGTVVVGDWGAFGVRIDDEDNDVFDELFEDWKRVE